MRDNTVRNWYKDMFLLGTALNGQIRCSYLALYDKAGNFLFSLSPKPTYYTGSINLHVSTAEHLIGVRSGLPIEIVEDVKKQGMYTNAQIALESYGGEAGAYRSVPGYAYVVPIYNNSSKSYPISYMDFVVTAEDYSEDRFVPVKLTYYANKHIQEVIDSVNTKNDHGAWLVVDRLGDEHWYSFPGDKTVKDANGEMYTFPAEYVYRDAKYLRFREKLLPMLKSNEDFYIQPYQVKWYPANLDRYNEVMRTDYKPFTTDYTAKYTTSEQAERYMKLSKIAEAASVITLFI